MVRGICDVGGRCWVSNCVAVTRLSSLLQTWVRLLGARYTQSATKSFRDVVVVRSSPPTLRLPTVCTQWICSTSPSPSHDNRKCKLLPMLSGDSNGGILWYTSKLRMPLTPTMTSTSLAPLCYNTPGYSTKRSVTTSK